MTESLLVWLHRGKGPGARDDKLGGKAANLMSMAAAGFPVPAAFCLTTDAYHSFLDHNQLAPQVSPAEFRRAFERAPYPRSLETLILENGRELTAGGHQLAVRSSATVEDQAGASFAGQGDTVLGVQGDTELLAAVRQSWASLWSVRAQSYRNEEVEKLPEMAVIVQQMIPCQVAGIAFSVDPVDGDPAVVVEAVPGLGDKLAAGQTAGERYRVQRGLSVPDSLDASLLSAGQLEQIASLALAAEEHFGAPQDIEWGFLGETLYLFQSRPITVQSSGFFTEQLSDDQYLWTGGFFNERFPRPVSPLGWSLLSQLLVPLALGDPLRFLGVPPSAVPPLVKLYRGHPYANVAAFQMLYAVFPKSLLPADSYRYFPGGDTSLRHRVNYPRSVWHPRTFFSLARTFLGRTGAASPWHNWRVWKRFERHHEQVLTGLRDRFLALTKPRSPAALWRLLQEAQNLDRRLLQLHRWSLTLADLTYTSLRGLLSAWLPSDEDGDSVAIRLVSGLPSYSLELNAALHCLAAGRESLQSFLERFGHRSYDLDIAHPTFADDPTQVTELIVHVEASDAPDFASRAVERQRLQSEIEARIRFWQRPLFRHVLRLTQAYVQLRENQRFVWQRSLAFQRQVLLALGSEWFEEPETIFGATIEEVEASVVGRETLPRDQINIRCAELHRLEDEHRRAPQLTYPAFLRGNQPLEESEGLASTRWFGLPVSPGVGHGPVRVVLSPEQFDLVRPGDILVTRGADPGWTPLFGVLAGLVLETGGQLSHGAVVAREYGLPAVAAIPSITTLLQDGQMVTVDGRTGLLLVDDY